MQEKIKIKGVNFKGDILGRFNKKVSILIFDGLDGFCCSCYNQTYEMRRYHEDL